MRVSNRLRVVAQRKKERREGEAYRLQELEEGMDKIMKIIFFILLPFSSVALGIVGGIVHASVVEPFWFEATGICLIAAWMMFIFAMWPGRWLTLMRAKYAFRIKSYLRAIKEDANYFSELSFRYLTSRG